MKCSKRLGKTRTGDQSLGGGFQEICSLAWLVVSGCLVFFSPEGGRAIGSERRLRLPDGAAHAAEDGRHGGVPASPQERITFHFFVA